MADKLVEVKLFVGRLPRSMDEVAVRPLFEEFGRVIEVAIIRDKATQVHKGSAFVRMSSLSQADSAIRSLNNVRTLDPQMGPMQVRYAVGEAEKLGIAGDVQSANINDQAKLFIGSIPKSMSEDDVRLLFSQFGPIDEVYIMKDNTTGEGKGCAFIKFTYKEHAVQAIKGLNAHFTVPGAPRPIEVRFAEAKRPGSTGPIPTTTANPAAVAAAASAHFPGVSQPKPVINKNLNPRIVGPWKEFFNNDGRPYYHNEKENRTQWERPVEFDVLKMRQSSIAGPTGANLLITNLPSTWTDKDLYSAFCTFGKVISARVAFDPVSGWSKGYGYVSYDSVNGSAAAYHNMNGWPTEGKTLVVTIQTLEEETVAPVLYSLMAKGPGGAGPNIQRKS